MSTNDKSENTMNKTEYNNTLYKEDEEINYKGSYSNNIYSKIVNNFNKKPKFKNIKRIQNYIKVDIHH